MKSDEKTLLRPRCKKCGKRIYRDYNYYMGNLWRNSPSYCSNCGEEISVEERKHLVEHEETIYGLRCILSCINRGSHFSISGNIDL